ATVFSWSVTPTGRRPTNCPAPMPRWDCPTWALAAAALTVPGDLATPPARTHADRLAALDDAAWETLRLGPGWTDHVPQDTEAEEEVRTP
ncbi:hypothetical protein ABZ369_14250, partial [Streptomyces sp. NPDC005918]